MNAGNSPANLSGSPSRNYLPLVFGVVGVLVGVWMAKGLASPDMERKRSGEPTIQAPQKQAVSEPSQTSQQTAAAHDGTQPTDAATEAPFNPSDDEIWANALGGDVSASPAGTSDPGSNLFPPITGNLPSQPVPPLNPVVVKGPEEIEAVPHARFAEYISIVGEAEVATVAGRILAAAKAAGSTVQDSGEIELSKGGVARVLILSVDPKKSTQLESDVVRAGDAQKNDAWSGPYSERRHRMERSLRTQLEELEKLKSQLLIKYLEDAPAVVECTERIAAINRQLASMKAVPASLDVIRVYVGSKVTA